MRFICTDGWIRILETMLRSHLNTNHPEKHLFSCMNILFHRGKLIFLDENIIIEDDREHHCREIRYPVSTIIYLYRALDRFTISSFSLVIELFFTDDQIDPIYTISVEFQ